MKLKPVVTEAMRRLAWARAMGHKPAPATPGAEDGQAEACPTKKNTGGKTAGATRRGKK
jgi:hypothetical protein